ncbi:MAG TPA: hypothetical protein DCS93_28005 [Microscillaceae bacterium]|nr:hypothetical protein [Microscillaceae bacterium]
MSSYIAKMYNPWIVTFLSVLASTLIYLVVSSLFTVKDFRLGLILSVSIPVVIAFPISFIMIHYHRQITQQKLEIEEKNAELSQSNEEIATQRDLLEVKTLEVETAHRNITASIAYARRIQNAILPSVRLIQQVLPESFILFQPRDIVSGDFYWFAHVKDDTPQGKSVLTAADCTGHGVPGALMSMIGNDLLNDIVEVKGITEPDEILQRLHTGVIKALKQEENDNRDGMDLALCTIDWERRLLHFAGAKNSLILIENGHLTEIKGDKHPIGASVLTDTKHTFTSHTIELGTEPKCFYIFSDGFQDQFGGPRNRKFMTKRFRQRLLEIYQEPMLRQQQLLEDTLSQWRHHKKGMPEPQTDDILVVGFKINS